MTRKNYTKAQLEKGLNQLESAMRNLLNARPQIFSKEEDWLDNEEGHLLYEAFEKISRLNRIRWGKQNGMDWVKAREILVDTSAYMRTLMNLGKLI